MHCSRRFAFRAILGLAGPLVIGCGSSDEGNRVANLKPMVLIKGGPLSESRASYTARIFWSGWDEDGIVTHYEYAEDPPSVFSPAEVSDPEHSPGVSISLVPGPGQEQDTLVVSKTADGEVYSFRWVQTREFSRAFAFQTPHADSVNVNGILVPAETYSGAHTVYVRCRDNDGDYSDTNPETPELDVDYIGYTAFTQTPSSRILRPDVTREISNLGSTVSLRWDGVDNDSPEADKKPVAFYYKLLRLDTLVPPLPILGAKESHLRTKPGPWIYQRGDTLDKILQLGVPGQYMFGLLAVDVAGAVEPQLKFGRNVFKFQAFPNGGRPVITIREASAGTLVFRGGGAPQEIEVPANRKLRFTWDADAREYGGTIEAFSWGLDIPDLTVEGPESGWSVWGPIYGNLEPIVFAQAGVHVLYVRARDVAGAITLASLILEVIDFPFDSEVLYVDDSPDGSYPRDSEHDSFWFRAFDYYAANSDIPASQFVQFQVFGVNDAGNYHPSPPLLKDLSKYKLLIWECRGSGYNAESALVIDSAFKPRLRSYLAAGGKLWLGGRSTVAATTPSENLNIADFTYPKLELGPGDFAWDVLKLHSTRIENDLADDGRNTIWRAKPVPGEIAYYDTLSLDVTKLNSVQAARGGATHADAVFDPIFAESEPDFAGDIDSLYIYGAAGPEVQGRGSGYQNKLCAIRWHDPDPDRVQGRIQWFGFPLYYFLDSQVHVVFRKSMDWFREEEPDSP